MEIQQVNQTEFAEMLKSAVFYHLQVSSKREMAQAKRLVIFFAKSLLPKSLKQSTETLLAICAA